MSKILKPFAVLSLLLMATGCATNPVTGKSDFVLMSEQQEVALGAQTHTSVMQQYTVYDNPRVQQLVERLGQELAANSHRSHLDFTFTVLDSPEVNAFATPGGYVYITRGIMAYMNSEEQLAGVLGHEIGHVTARHGVRQHSAQTTSQTAAGLLGVLIAGATKNKRTGQVIGQTTSQLGQAFVRGYGREHELEADRLGAEYLAGLGYDPDMMLGVIGILKDQEEFERQRAQDEGRQPRIYHGVFSTHPRNDQRLQEVIAAADRFRTANPKHTDPEAFLRLMDGVTFGSGESQGVLRNNKFYHKPLDLAIDFPQGWRVDNQPDQLFSLNTDRNAAITIQLGKRGKNRTPEQFLRSNFKNLQRIERYDSDTYTALIDGKTPFGQAPVLVAAVFHGDNVLVVNGFARQGLPDNAFFNTVESVRNLNRSERKLASERRIRLVRSKPGDTFEKLAASSKLDRYAVDQLRLLNGLYPDGQPEPGQLIKIIK